MAGLDDSTIALLNLLIPHFPDFPASKISVFTLDAQLFPEEKPNPQRIYDRFSYLVKATETWMAFAEMQAQEFDAELLLLAALRRRGSVSLFDKRKKKLEKRLAQAPLSEPNLAQKFRLAAEKERLFQEQLIEEARTQSHLLQEMVDTLDNWYAHAKLKFGAEMLNRSRILNVEYKVSGMAPVLSHSPTSQSPLRQFYLRIYQMNAGDEEETAFWQLRELLQNHWQGIERDELRAFYQYAENFCIRKINEGRKEFPEILFAMYKELREREMMTKGGVLSQWDLKNVVSLAVRVGKTDWGMAFTEAYRDKLEPAVRENAFAYNRAVLLHAAGRPGDALRQLQQVEFTDLFYNLGARSLMLKIYFEEKETDALFSHISAFRTYLRRSRVVSDAQRRVYRNLLSFTAKLYRLQLKTFYTRPQKMEKLLAELKSEIEAAQGIANKNWLQKMVAEIL